LGYDLFPYDFNIASRQFIDGSPTIERCRNTLSDARFHIGGKLEEGLAKDHYLKASVGTDRIYPLMELNKGINRRLEQVEPSHHPILMSQLLEEILVQVSLYDISRSLLSYFNLRSFA
jgi:hypothetical protein